MNSKSKGRLLVVDDEMPLLRALCQTLSDEGYTVTGASSGTEALAALPDARPEVILTDLMMPKMDGITLLREAQTQDPRLVGLVMTGHGSIETAVAAMKGGATDYVLKPVKLLTLLPVLERALAIQRLRVKNEELERRIRQRTTELEIANEELEAFTSSISHDLRTPLRAVSGFVDILLADPALSGDARRYVELIHSGAEEMSNLITHLLAFSRIGREPIVRKTVDLDQLFRAAYDAMQGERAGRLVEIRLAPLGSATGDPTLLRLVAINLLSNAIKYTRGRNPAVIEVGLDASASESGPAIYVRDNGVGFDMADAGKLFSVFQRLHHAREFEGVGVGLATVRRIVERHGGRIWAEAAPDAGATFWFTLSDELDP